MLNRIQRVRIGATLGTTAFLLLGCSTTPDSADVYTPRTSVLRPGDRLLLFDRNAPELRHLARVCDSGLVKLPFLGRQFVLGMSEEDAAETLTDRYRNHFQSVDLQIHRIPASHAN